jgi:hypothetical protein
MNADIYVEWLRRQGHQVIRTESSFWYDAGPRVFQAYPYHWTIEPTEAELRNLFLDHNAIALRYSAPINSMRGMVSYHVVCENSHYDLDTLSRQAKQNVRRGLEFASFEQIGLARLAEEGWRLRQDSLERQGRMGAESEAYWRRLCTSAEGLPGFEVWAAVHDGSLAATFLAFQCDDVYTLPLEQSATEFLENRVNNAIFYYVTHQAINRQGVSSVFFCLHSLDAPCSVDQFKFRMGYTAKPVRQRVVFHPWLEPFANPLAHKLVSRLFLRNHGNATLAKFEGMLRFNLQGKLPMDKQEWPDCLAEYKTIFLGPQPAYEQGTTQGVNTHV